MDKFLHTPERDEQKGRVEDGPLGLKHKFTDWPNIGDSGSLGAKGKGAKAAKGKISAKSGYKSAGARTSSIGGGKSGGGSASKGK